MDDAPSTGQFIGMAILGAVGLLIVWQIVGSYDLLGTTISAPTEIVEVFGDGATRSNLIRAGLVTMREAIFGFLWGLVLAAIAGLIAVSVPWLRRGVDQLATIESAIPFVALGPILIATVDRTSIASAMAAATAFFTMYVAIVAGLRSASSTVEDVFTVFGSSRRQRLVRSHVPAALPVISTGLKVAMPLTIVGAVIGEWFGASKGIGPLILVAVRNYRMPDMWAAAVVTVVVALILFGVMAVLERATLRRFA